MTPDTHTRASVLTPDAPVPVLTLPVPVQALLAGEGLSSGGVLAPVLGRGTEGGALSIDVQRRGAFVDGRLVPLTAREYLLIELLFTSRGRLFSRDDLLERLWGLDFSGDARVVDTYVKRLRGKLGAGAIETVRGLGYRCPLPETGRVPQPHLQRLPREARLLTRLAQRVLQVTDSAHIMADLYEQLREHYDVQEVSLWRLPDGELLARAGSRSGPGGTVLPGAALHEPALHETGLSGGATGSVPLNGTAMSGTELSSTEPGLALVPLYGVTDSATPWALLAFAGPPEQGGWPLDVRSALDSAASLVNLALRLNLEIGQREQAERQVRALNAELEERVAARTQQLAHAHANLNTLYDLAQTLARADGLQGVLRQGLGSLAALSGASVCSIWQLRATELSCLAAFTPGHQDCTALLQREAALLAAALRQSVALTAEGETLTRSATLPGGRQLLLIPVAPGLPEVHALHLELPGGLQSDMVQLDAAARAFGLAFERQWQAQQVERAALSDDLTGLPNRRALLADLTAELSYSQRHRQLITLSLFELRDIREVNRRSGNAAGNDLIRALADRLRATLRLEDRLYRLGGAVLVSLVRSETVAEAQAIQARLDRMATGFGTQLQALPLIQPGDGQVWASHASSPDETVKLSDLLHLALQRLERAPEGQQP